ncbi:hypothetical protein AVEN_105824-1, partial [Araneus ventricosus]
KACRSSLSLTLYTHAHIKKERGDSVSDTLILDGDEIIERVVGKKKDGEEERGDEDDSQIREVTWEEQTKDCRFS